MSTWQLQCRVTWEDSHIIIVNLRWSSHLERSLNEGLTRSSWLADRPVVLLTGLLDVGRCTLNMGNAIFWAGAWTEWKGKNKLSISKACMHSFSLCSWAWIWLDDSDHLGFSTMMNYNLEFNWLVSLTVCQFCLFKEPALFHWYFYILFVSISLIFLAPFLITPPTSTSTDFELGLFCLFLRNLRFIIKLFVT